MTMCMHIHLTTFLLFVHFTQAGTLTQGMKGSFIQYEHEKKGEEREEKQKEEERERRSIEYSPSFATPDAF